MTTSTLVTFLVVVAVASYLQALTGFALGIFALGGVILLDLSSLATAALVINVLMVTNVVLALRKSWHAINVRLALVTLSGIVPGAVAGLWLLGNLGEAYAGYVQLALGLLIVGAGVTMCVNPKPRSLRSPSYQFVFYGLMGGVFGGLYSIPGPPVVFLFYRQPLSIAVVRATLLAVFGLMSIFRLIAVAGQAEIPLDAVELSLWSMPVVIAVSALFARFPPSLPDVLLRRAAFVLLVCMGGFISATALQ
ncbi:sulfite exporter TauE/SafE family protein [Achromobacter aegrifaciens]|uniref:Probable membrane transporter protein n=1 Tax=Achromobacter aegrifaciens TaxID=1287736 RepID=A0AAD2QE70_ACHAE|nr:sulfite exporter TauE/SafE family protein [Achromobacter aegrifaciens]CUJ68905.1 Sulfite exporter TauE/SafE [Achromobacter aegrifaciens]